MGGMGELLRHWGIPAVVIFMLGMIFKEIIGRFATFVIRWVFERFRRLAYWSIDKGFVCFGRISVGFALEGGIQLADFIDWLRESSLFADLQGGLAHDNSIELALAEMRDVKLEIDLEFPDGEVGFELKRDGECEADPAELTVRWKSVSVRYREVKKFLGVCQRAIDEIVGLFGRFVNAPDWGRSIHVQFYFKRNLKFDLTRRVELPARNRPLTITSYPGMMEFGTNSFHCLSDCLPWYLASGKTAGSPR